mgnify:CR=1 FL=1
MEFKQLTAMIFASGEPAEASRLASVLELDEETVHKICARIAAELEERASGLTLVRLDNSYQLCTRTEYAGQIKALLDIRRNMPLSQAALEVLAIVAYNQPVTKAFAEQVRGVNCSSIFATLMNKGLELIEAMHLFSMLPEKISIVIHRESIIHSMVEYIDHAVLAQMGVPDMRLCIQYAATPARLM